MGVPGSIEIVMASAVFQKKEIFEFPEIHAVWVSSKWDLF